MSSASAPTSSLSTHPANHSQDYQDFMMQYGFNNERGKRSRQPWEVCSCICLNSERASSLYVDGVSWGRAARMLYASGYMSIPKHSAKIRDIYAITIRPVITLWYSLNPNLTLSHLAH
eukprot:scaffold109918_cov25-Cyclotella_meneghiniana.AAC.1